MPRSGSAPTCFVVLPVRSPGSSGRAGLSVDSNDLFSHVERVMLAAGFVCVRADFVIHRGFVETSMAERLLIAELVIADLAVASPKVMHTIGMRQGKNSRPTILITGRGHENERPNEPHTSDVVPYLMSENNEIDPGYGTIFDEALMERVRRAIGDDFFGGIPLLDATGWSLGARLEHDKTDVFLERIARTSDIGRRIRDARTMSDSAASIDALNDLERELLDGASETADLDTGVLGVYIAYREGKAYQHMVDLYERMPPELQSTPVALEQLALALNRLAEANDRGENESSSSPLREQALAVLDSLEGCMVTAETLAIRGRIYKGWFHAAVASGDGIEARAMLDKAIETYEEALRADMRDYFPGINVITLRLTRGTPEDVDVVAALVPVVRFAVENAPKANSEQERYWQIATKLELACAARDWDAAYRHVEAVVRLDVDDWMLETTIENLDMYRTMLGGDVWAVTRLDGIVEGLKP